MMQKQTAIIVFLRNPEPGKVKTRLAAEIGDHQAYLIYKRLLEITRSVLDQVDADKWLFYSEFIGDDDWSKDRYHKEIQKGNDLGERMANAFLKVLQNGYKRVLIIGSDCPGLQVADIEEAIRGLEEKDLVFGPALDGGYYLLGMKDLYMSMFQEIPWSESDVLKISMKKAEESGLTYSCIETRRDIDYLADLQHFPQLLEGIQEN